MRAPRAAPRARRRAPGGPSARRRTLRGSPRPDSRGRRRGSPLVDRDLDGAGIALGGDGDECVAPALERKRVRQHPREVDPTVGDEVEVVADAVLPFAVDGLDPERVRPDPGDLLEVEGAPLPSSWRVHAALYERAARLENADAHLERLRLADGV